jgi:uncharacterized membrane protein YoaK (UPF0700 family)
MTVSTGRGDTAEVPRASAWRALVADPRHGPLPLILLALTVGTGIVDAVSILSLGRVFVANMTGNVAFIGFAIAGAPGFSLGASVVALLGFLLGALTGGVAARRLGANRAVLIAAGSGAELLLIGAATLTAHAVGEPFGSGSAEVLAGLCAIALGIQNAVARRLAVPDLTTTVLTMTLTGIAADRVEGTQGQAFLRRFLSVAAMLGGAVAGTVLVLHASTAAALVVLTTLLALVTAAATATARRPADWHAA